MHAVRIGDGVIVTGPGETFTEYGIAVKERSPGAPTLYAGYTNEILGYLPTANEYQYGGYEAGYGYKSVGLPSLFDPSVEQILVETGVRLAERLFPDAEPWDEADGLARAGRRADGCPTPARAPLRGRPADEPRRDRRRCSCAARRGSRLEPPLDLPLVGFVRQTHDATGYGRCGLETSAIALEQDGLPRRALRRRHRRHRRAGDLARSSTGSPRPPAPTRPGSSSTGTTRTCPSIGGAWGGECAGPPEPERDARIRRFADVVQDKVVSVCRARVRAARAGPPGLGRRVRRARGQPPRAGA